MVEFIVKGYFLIGALLSALFTIVLIWSIFEEMASGNTRENPPSGTPHSFWGNVVMAPFIMGAIIGLWAVFIPMIVSDWKTHGDSYKKDLAKFVLKFKTK